MIGPMIAGRLYGKASKIAMTLRVPRPDGLVDVGDAALVRLAVDEVLDPQTGAVLQQHIPSGVQHLITALRQAFGVQDHDLATQSLERFFGLTRGRMSLAEYNVEFETRFDEAHDRAGLVINDVAKFYLFFKNSGLSNKAIDDIKLQVQGDFTRFNDARSLALRLAPAREETSGDVFYQEDEIHSVHLQDTWNSPSSHQWHDNYETSGAYYWEDEGVWFWDPASEDYDDQYYDASGWPPDYDEYEQYEEEYADYGEQDEQAADAEETTGEPTTEEYYGNKGKGKSNEGCFKCGSKWHMARDCPTNSNHGKSSKGSKGYGKSKNKGKRKGAWRWRPSYKGKGYGGKNYGGGFNKSKGKGKKGKYSWYSRPSTTTIGEDGLQHVRPSPLDSFDGLHSRQAKKSPDEFTIHTPPNEDFMKIPRKAAPAKSEDADQAQEQMKPEKKFNEVFNFAFNYYEAADYFMVRGQKRRGLIIDPGAASGLIGTETLRDLIDNCVKPFGLEVAIEEDVTTPVSGIDGKSDQTLGRVTVPLMSSGKSITFTGEMLGGEGSLCPALVGNPSLRKMNSVLFANYFENGDGLLVIDHQSGDVKPTHLMRLLLTDSGHYILATDTNKSEQVNKETEKETFAFCSQVLTASIKKWSKEELNDRLLHVFAVTLAGGNRCEENFLPDKQPEGKHHQMYEPKNMETNVEKGDDNLDTEKTNDAGQDVSRDVSQGHGTLPTTASEEKQQDPQARQVSKTETKQVHFEMDDEKNKIEEFHMNPHRHPGDPDFPAYTEDMVPPEVDQAKMNKRYKAIPEEFYTRTGLRPVTPWNFRKWFEKSRGRGTKWHFWEIFSGTGRLSLILYLAGLSIGFPVDYRYGWNLNNASHRAMLWEAQQEFQPGAMHYAPDCAPWSVSSSSKDPGIREQERLQDRPALKFVQDSSEEQSRYGRGFTVEQPLGSAMWEEGLHLSRIPDCRKKQRVDQCMHGAQDENNSPIQKATGLESNIKYNRTALRCNGHRGQPHAHLRGQGPGGVNRTAAAAAYPKTMCHRMKMDIINFLHKRKLLNVKVESFYDCIRCQLGRFCPPEIEHTMKPGDCRYGRSGMRTRYKKPDPSSASDPIADWKRTADKTTLDIVTIENQLGKELEVEHSHYLKKLLIEIIDNSMGLFNEATERRVIYDHWVDKPVMTALFKEIFKDILHIKGIKVNLKPWRKSNAEPTLAITSSYLRIHIRGNVKKWKIHPMEDMREMSFNQINEAIQEDEWMVTLFGMEKEEARAAPSTPSYRPRSIPPQPALPPRADDDLPAEEVEAEAGEEQQLAVPQVQERPEDPREEEAIVQPAYEEFDAHGRAALAPIKPSYNLRRVLERLPKLVASGELAVAKRLLVGLHERLWHTPIMDFSNLLRRSGQPQEVIDLAVEAVKGCVVCRKFVRLLNRPQVRVGGATIFNNTVQMDLFVLNGTNYLLMVDEATRFKTCAIPEGLEAAQLMSCMLQSWIYLFGPPARLVLDQQPALMGHEAAAEFERLGMERVPKGTTRGHGADQHTGTGLAERHVQLIKLTMMKLQAELQRQGLNPEPLELGQESAMAHNQTLNYGGVTPCMSVFGILPRGFYDPESPGVLSMDGSTQRDVTVFERAMRIRQTALAQTQQAIIEDRVARANKHRPHQLETDQLTAGVSEVEYYREIAGDPGWRGPALLLRLDQGEGVAVIQYQGKPYLVALRHIRPYRGVFHFEMKQDLVEQELHKLMRYVEGLSDYKVYIMGWIRKGKDGKWTKTPKESPLTKNVMQWADKVSNAMTRAPLHGLMMGRSLRTFKPPNNTHGKLFTWLQGGRTYSVQEHKNSNHLRLKKISNHAREDLCVLYFYYYQDTGPEETSSLTRPTTSEEKERKENNGGEMDVDNQSSKKRDGPETRTVVIAPEKKRQKIAMMQKDVEFLQSFYLNSNQNKIILDYSEEWRTGYDFMVAAVRHFLLQGYEQMRQRGSHLFNIAYKTTCKAAACLRTAEIFKVDEDTNDINEDKISPDLWPQIDAADKAEIKQFVDEGAFKKLHQSQFTSEMVIIDARWVRKWKRYPDRSLRVKSRLCARGFLDQQKDLLTTRSTTATRLSQRILLSQAARKKSRRVESLDVAGAFLKGFSFQEIQKALQAAGYNAPHRVVVILPPLNVFRHLAELSKDFANLNDMTATQYGLLLNKPVYGLNDAPLAWQLCLHQFLKSLGGNNSQLDDCTFVWKTKNKDKETELEAMATTHVDDIALTGTQQWLDSIHNKFLTRFGKVTRQTLPFDHCGCKYERTDDGYKISQTEFAKKLKPAPVPQRADESKLVKDEVSNLRSILGALLWLTATRIDIIADLSILQSRVTVAEVKDLKQANEILTKVNEFIDLGLHYRYMEDKHVRLMCIHDASSSSKGRYYAQEGLLIGLAADKFHNIHLEPETVFNDGDGAQGVDLHGGFFHILHASGSKAKRISYSTSHAETLSMIGGLEASTMIMIRLSELHHPSAQPTVKQLIQVQEQGDPKIPMDFYGDCRDLFELTTGLRTLPQDRSQRLYTLGLKEARISGKMRLVTLVPTEAMTADSLTKPMIHDCLLHLLTTGIVRFFNMPSHHVTSRTLPALTDFDEHDLLKADSELITEVQEGQKQVKVGHAALLLGLFSRHFTARVMTAALVTTSTVAQEIQEINAHAVTSTASPMSSSVPNYANYWSVYFMIFLTVILAVNLDKVLKYAIYLIRKLQKEKDSEAEPMDVDAGRLDYMDVDEDGDPKQMSKTIRAMKRKLEDAKHDRQKIRTQLNEKEEEAHDYKTQAKSWMDCSENYSQKIEIAQKNHADKMAEYDDLKNRFDKLREDADFYKDEYDAINEKLQTHKFEVGKVQYQLDHAEETIRNQRGMLTGIQDQCNKLEAENQKYESLMEKKDKQLKDLLLEKRAWEEQKKSANKSPYRDPQTLFPSENGLFPPGEPSRPTIGQSAELFKLKEELAASKSTNETLVREVESLKGDIAQRNQGLQDLSARLEQAQGPDKIFHTRNGTCYHKESCNHLQHGKESRPKVELRRCRDCFP